MAGKGQLRGGAAACTDLTAGMSDALLTKAFGTSREKIGAHYDHNSAQEALD